MARRPVGETTSVVNWGMVVPGSSHVDGFQAVPDHAQTHDVEPPAPHVGEGLRRLVAQISSERILVDEIQTVKRHVATETVDEPVGVE